LTVGELEEKLGKLGYNNFQFHLIEQREVEAMVELEDGSFLGVVGMDLDVATEGLLAKLKYREEGVSFGPESYS
jgi:hypothetical protein